MKDLTYCSIFKADDILHPYKVKYPAGEVGYSGLPFSIYEDAAQSDVIEFNIRNMDDFVFAWMFMGRLSNYFNTPPVLLPYLPFSRDDHYYNHKSSYGLSIIKSFAAEYGIYTYDPHCDLEGMNIHPACKMINNEIPRHLDNRYSYFVLADKSAGRTLDFLGKCGRFIKPAQDNVLQALKDRDKDTGELSNFRFHGYDFTRIESIKEGDTILVVDDICDGGGTFIPIVNNLKEHCSDIFVDLYVTHGIFSKGVEHLKEHYRNIYCFNNINGVEL